MANRYFFCINDGASETDIFADFNKTFKFVNFRNRIKKTNVGTARTI